MNRHRGVRWKLEGRAEIFKGEREKGLLILSCVHTIPLPLPLPPMEGDICGFSPLARGG
ncbi:MAG: hypothetical protein KGI30_06675 [Planctomycetota bacterium]|nr:hypothetical protein [Planctomycetota bacterium]